MAALKPGRSGAVTESTYANGIRAAREAKGYTRGSVTEALGLTANAYWNVEVSEDPKVVKEYLAKIKALPDAPVKERAKKAASEKKATTSTKAKATTKTKAKPAAATDLI